MRIKGKISIWFWGVAVGANLVMIYSLCTDENKIAIFIGWILLNLLLLPILFRNYVEIKDMYKIHDPISTTAASFDRTVLKGWRQELRCVTEDRDVLYQELKKYSLTMEKGLNVFVFFIESTRSHSCIFLKQLTKVKWIIATSDSLCNFLHI